MTDPSPDDARRAPDADSPALWGGVECTVNRVHDRYFNQLERSGHSGRPSDLERLAGLGLKAVRYPALWECHAPRGPQTADWSWLDARLPALRRLGLRTIAGLVHHGSGPPDTDLLDAAFAPRLRDYAQALARRYPWIDDYTPVNEPLTTARFSALYGTWYPHARSDAAFVRALLNQCRAVVLAMQAVHEVNPRARLVQTEDLGKTYSRPALAGIAGFYNERRWLTWDLLCGRVDAAHPLHGYLLRSGATARELAWFTQHPCPPDLIGVNYYVTGERWLDEQAERFPPHCRGGAGAQGFADIEVPRAVRQPLPGIAPLLREAWARYRIPIAITEVHIDANREDQLRWFDEVWRAARQVRQEGVALEAVTAWALLGTFDWNSLVTCDAGYYEPGAFDVRSEPPRETAMATLLRELAQGGAGTHPVLAGGQGWWRRPEGRFLCDPPVEAALDRGPAEPVPAAPALLLRESRPVLVVGAAGTLGSAFRRICAQRDLACVALRRQELDILDPAAVTRAIGALRPWAVVNAGGYVRVDDAERDAARCLQVNVDGAAVLARACEAVDSRLLCFSSDLVFDGESERPYVESDAAAPLNVYGHSKALAEEVVLRACRGAMVVRTSAFFGPWDSRNFLTQALRAMAAQTPIWASDDITVSPTYVPDLVHACLDLLIDGETGLWHLSNGWPLTWADWLRQGARMGGVAEHALALTAAPPQGHLARRPRNSALGTERGRQLPSFESAMDRFFRSLSTGDARADLAPVAVR